MEISLVGAGYWGSKLQKELETIPGVDKVEIIDIKDGKSLDDIQYNNVVLRQNNGISFPVDILLILCNDCRSSVGCAILCFH